MRQLLTKIWKVTDNDINTEGYLFRTSALAKLNSKFLCTFTVSNGEYSDTCPKSKCNNKKFTYLDDKPINFIEAMYIIIRYNKYIQKCNKNHFNSLIGYDIDTTSLNTVYANELNII